MTFKDSVESSDIEAHYPSLAEPLLVVKKKHHPPFDPTNSIEDAYSVSMKLEAVPATRRQSACLVGSSVFLIAIAVVELAFALPLLWSSSAGITFPGFQRYPRFLVIGDWGRRGCCNQTVVADAMARKARQFRPDFIVSSGDNFYEAGLVSPDDTLFDESFSDIYTHTELRDVPWHSVLGNHDYGETDKPHTTPEFCSREAVDNKECFWGPAHQLDVRLPERDPRWHCERFFTLTLAGGAVEIHFIDTTPIIRSYADEVWAVNRGGVAQQSWEDQVREVEARLAASRADWKFVVGHHPIRTNHRRDHEFRDMVEQVEPLLVRYNVRGYFAGHDHNLQYLHDPDTGYHHITSGAGSDIGSGFYGNKHSPFQHAGNGFVAVEVGRRSTRVEYMGVDSDQPLFVVDIPKAA